MTVAGTSEEPLAKPRAIKTPNTMPCAIDCSETEENGRFGGGDGVRKGKGGIS